MDETIKRCIQIKENLCLNSKWVNEYNWTNYQLMQLNSNPANQLLHYNHEQDKNWWWKWRSCCILVLLFVIIILNNADDDDDDCQLELKRTWWADINANKCKHLYFSLSVRTDTKKTNKIQQMNGKHVSGMFVKWTVVLLQTHWIQE